MESMKRVAIVTGGARGIGRAIAESFAARGIVPAIADIDLSGAETTVAELRKTCPEAAAFRVDMSSPADIATMVAAVVARFGRLDILVNNAGILSNTPWNSIDEDEWNRVMAINLSGVLFASREALKVMVSAGWGRIVNRSSLGGRNGGVSVGPAYAASKAGVIGLTRHLGRKVAGTGVTVNAVAPGTTETDIIKGFTESDMVAINSAIPMGRLGKPEEIAETVAFLASEAAGFITGAVLDVNGGMYMG